MSFHGQSLKKAVLQVKETLEYEDITVSRLLVRVQSIQPFDLPRTLWMANWIPQFICKESTDFLISKELGTVSLK